MKSLLVAAGFSLRWHRLESLCHLLQKFSEQNLKAVRSGRFAPRPDAGLLWKK
jgi:hypothetical protein